MASKKRKDVLSAVPKNRGLARSLRCGMLSLTSGDVAAAAKGVQNAKNRENDPKIFRSNILSVSRLQVGAPGV